MKKVFFCSFAFAISVLNADTMLQFQQVKEPNGGYMAASFMRQLKDAFGLSTFVETGTFYGMTSRVASTVFDAVHTTEIGDDLFCAAQKYLADCPNVSVYHGDSAEQLAVVLQKIKKPAIFFLDAHYSGPGTSRKDIENCPTMRELSMIKKYGSPMSVLIVDDIRFFQNTEVVRAQQQARPEEADAAGGYPSLSQVMMKMLEINPDYSFVIFGDELIAYPSTSGVTVSPVLQAMTLTRFALDNVYKNIITSDMRAQAEKTIMRASGIEKDGITYLAHSNICNQEVFSALYRSWYELAQSQK